ncbi:MAG: choice-of-anchor P family protein [Acidimicrobiales bacterium]
MDPPPNTVIPLPGVGTLTLNEQKTTTGPGGNRSITVNAVHLHPTGLVVGDV